MVTQQPVNNLIEENQINEIISDGVSRHLWWYMFFSIDLNAVRNKSYNCLGSQSVGILIISFTNELITIKQVREQRRLDFKYFQRYP